MNAGQKDTLAALRANELLTMLPDEELLRIAAVARPRRFLRNSALYAPGDLATDLFVIVEGKVKLFYSTVDGDEVVLDVIRPGQQTGAVTVLDENPVHFLQATAVEPTRCFSIPRDAFVAVVARQPMLTRRLLTGMRRRVHHDAQVAFLDVRARVASRLLSLSGALPGPEVRISQAELAGLVAASRPNINRALAALAGEGIVQVARGSVSIRDLKRLVEVARENPRP
jgi:CRP-like cAMP-binding protein